MTSVFEELRRRNPNREITREHIDALVQVLWLSFNEFSEDKKDQFTSADADLFFEVTKHPAIQNKLN